MPRLTLTAIVILTLLTSCSNHRSPRAPTSSARDTAPPLVRSDRDVFDPAPAQPGAPGGSPGNGTGRAGSTPGVGAVGGGGNRGAAVPEPGTMLLVGTGLAVAAFSQRRRKRAES
jgi:hypothetical protein